MRWWLSIGWCFFGQAICIGALLTEMGSPARGEEPAATTTTPSADPEGIEFFERRVRPLLVKHCYECHATTSKTPQGGLLLDQRSEILQGGDSGAAVVPGKPDESLLITAVRYGEMLQMPPAGRLTDREIADLVEWVQRGLPFPELPGSPTARPKRTAIDGRDHWAFRPLRNDSPHAPLPHDWVQRRTDGYVRDGHVQQGLAPSPPVSRAKLLRRMKFDLLGLPTTPEELQEFATDSSPDAIDRWLDRYLASPQYGERWGRHWLDLARYCDVPEQWRVGPAEAWRYRDWVVRAWNSDLPYDQFIRCQLAADLLPDHDIHDLPALGFLGLSPTYWKELKLDTKVIKQVVAEEWEERIEAIGGTFLGLTLACARCHDHKYDPITTEDYYGLAGVLASIRLDDRLLLPPDQAEVVSKARAQVTEWEQQLTEAKKIQPETDESRQKIGELNEKIKQLQQSTPNYGAAMTYGVFEASLHVLPDGPHRTRLEYRPGEPQDVAINIRGNPNNPGKLVPRRFLSVLSANAPRVFQQGSGRAELADALVTDASALTGRVFVNRIWKHHFGRGLVASVSNFGLQAEPPSHPALLDDLSRRFQTQGWSTKWLHRELMLSATYQQDSERLESGFSRDPDNLWLWRMAPRRLDVESWRDAMLSVTGTLDQTIGGASRELLEPNNRRRTLYGTVKRRELADMLRLYDFPDPVAYVGNREPTTTPLQQLFVLNSPFLKEMSQALVQRLNGNLKETGIQLNQLHRWLFGRDATAEEISLSEQFFQGTRAAGIADADAWQQYAQVLLGSNEFLFVD